MHARTQARLELSEAELQRVVMALPTVVNLSYEANLKPKLDFLQVVHVCMPMSLDMCSSTVCRWCMCACP